MKSFDIETALWKSVAHVKKKFVLVHNNFKYMQSENNLKTSLVEIVSSLKLSERL